ncbi:helix-turn-helix transcriptional regulator [Peptostreptococcus russellii]|uniref:helix-turn-helix domain-containing protein n=1 Tax=Peptostreptococcus russellii TaxID=215200 RepID=UPI0016286082|nr:helix-turn-helix transcriptional regulator [Peptostreptococcus russellii]MBC2578376.1 helix-turn-helix transcriptional regulator [Peptostreptococcus russellii]
MENIYSKYRRMAGITQERAAEHLGISVDSLKGYEYDKRIPNNDIAKQMCLLYGDMRLAYDHLVHSSTGEMILEKLDEKDLCCSVLSLINELNHSDHIREVMIEISADGVISDEEKVEWEIVEKQIKSLIKSSYEVLLRR